MSDKMDYQQLAEERQRVIESRAIEIVALWGEINKLRVKDAKLATAVKQVVEDAARLQQSLTVLLEAQLRG